jgi:hypothetical protein
MQGLINKYNKDYYGGGLMILIGLGVLLQGMKYKVGTLNRMGAGFFPVALGALLALTGTAIALSAKYAAKQAAKRASPVAAAGVPADEKTPAPQWRGWICITLSIVAFVVLGKYGGLLPATFSVVFIAAMGDRQNSIRSALVLSLAMALVAVVVFWWALQLQFPLFQWG